MNETSAVNNILIELHVPDFGKVKEFYGKLGFEVIWERKPEAKKGYLVMKLENNILCFWPGNKQVYNQSWFKQFPKNTKRGYGVEIILMIKNVESLYKKAKKFAKIVDKMQTKPWGLKDFRIVDPFGYYLRFSGPHNIFNKEKYAVK